MSFFTGALVASGWWVFVDGAVTAPDAFPWGHIGPGFATMVAILAINLVSPTRIQEASVKLWLFLWFTVAMVCVGVAVWITSVQYPPEYNWPGVTLILQTIFIFTGGVLFFIGRVNNSESDIFS